LTGDIRWKRGDVEKTGKRAEESSRNRVVLLHFEKGFAPESHRWRSLEKKVTDNAWKCKRRVRVRAPGRGGTCVPILKRLRQLQEK